MTMAGDHPHGEDVPQDADEGDGLLGRIRAAVTEFRPPARMVLGKAERVVDAETVRAHLNLPLPPDLAEILDQRDAGDDRLRGLLREELAAVLGPALDERIRRILREELARARDAGPGQT